MRRVVVTGMGIVSCIGNDLDSAADSLFEGRCGIRFVADYARRGFRSCVAGIPPDDWAFEVPRKLRRYMGDAAFYAYQAARAAILDAGWSAAELTDHRTGLVVGSGTGSPYEHHEAMEIVRSRGAEKAPAYYVPRIMGNTTSANLATAFGIRGASYSLVSACATSAHAIGHGMELIQLGKLDRVIVGGAEEVRWTDSVLFDAMGALSTGFNDRPRQASRPYDRGRDGFVIAGGAGILAIEALDAALGRGGRIHGEIAGYGATSDGADMVNPVADGVARSMLLAMEQAGTSVDCGIDYINAHATSTRVGDLVELTAIGQVFGNRIPPISSVKGLTGHSIGAAGAMEALFCLLMLAQQRIAGCCNLDEPEAQAAEYPLVRSTRAVRLESVLSNSIGFGGSNASLIFRRWQPARASA